MIAWRVVSSLNWAGTLTVNEPTLVVWPKISDGEVVGSSFIESGVEVLSVGNGNKLIRELLIFVGV